jgi:hypothetical protein
MGELLDACSSGLQAGQHGVATGQSDDEAAGVMDDEFRTPTWYQG